MSKDTPMGSQVAAGEFHTPCQAAACVGTKVPVFFFTSQTSADMRTLVATISEIAAASGISTAVAVEGVRAIAVPQHLLSTEFAYNSGNLVCAFGPSFDDAADPSQFLIKTAESLNKLYSHGINIVAAVHLQDLSAKMSAASRTSLEILASILGKAFYPRLVIGTTWWDSCPSVRLHGELREKQLTEGVLRNIATGGARFARINEYESAPDDLEASSVGDLPPSKGKSIRAVLADLVFDERTSPPMAEGEPPLLVDEMSCRGQRLLDTTASRTLERILQESKDVRRLIDNVGSQDGYRELEQTLSEAIHCPI